MKQLDPNHATVVAIWDAVDYKSTLIFCMLVLACTLKTLVAQAATVLCDMVLSQFASYVP